MARALSLWPEKVVGIGYRVWDAGYLRGMGYRVLGGGYWASGIGNFIFSTRSTPDGSADNLVSVAF